MTLLSKVFARASKVPRQAYAACMNQLRAHSPPPPKRYLSADLDSAYYSVISSDPPIFHVAHWMDEQLRLNASLDPIFEYLKNESAWFLYTWYWHIEARERVKMVKRYEQAHRRQYPRHRFIHLCNSPAQYEAFCAQGLRAVFCNQNGLVDEGIFRVIPEVEKRYDAIYDARFKSYKRHELCAEIDSLALIYIFQALIDDPAEAESIRQSLRHAHYFNHEEGRADGAYRNLSTDEVAPCLNEARVGLCLSAEEGAMYASIQYLLCGLPVVSTPSVGGRDVFFDEETSLIVDPTPEAVRRGVAEMAGRRLDPERVRAITLARVQRHRESFKGVVQSIYQEAGVSHRDYAKEWNQVFFNKMLNTLRHEDVIAQLARAKATGQP